MPHRYPHGQVTLKQTLDDALAKKASPAKDGHLSWRHVSVPMKTLQKFSSVHAEVHNHFNQERHLVTRQVYKQRRAGALAEWRVLAA